MKSFQKIIETSEGALDDSSHWIWHRESTYWGLSFKDALDSDRLDPEAMEEAVIATRHARRLLQRHVQQSCQGPGQ